MKKFKVLLFILLTSVTFGQIPAGYYNSATGTGYTLKTQLYNIIKNHTDFGYSGLYTTYLTSDKDFYYENDGTVLDMYTENPTGADVFEFTYGVNQDDGTGGTAEGQKYNREHTIPQSVFNSATPMYSDAHFIVPADKYVNGQRGDLPYGVVSTATKTFTNGTKKGPNLNSGYSSGYTGVVFEPIDEFKGDIARMLLYFATRYEDLVAGWNYTMFNNTSDQVFTLNAINVLVTWSNNDPVSQREIDRNNAIYDRQHNRNPYIDHQEYVMQIWGNLLSQNSFNLLNTIGLYPIPTNNHKIVIQSTTSIDTIEMYSVNGQLLNTIKNPVFENNMYELNDLPTGFYFVKLSNGRNSITKKIVVN